MILMLALLNVDHIAALRGKTTAMNLVTAMATMVQHAISGATFPRKLRKAQKSTQGRLQALEIRLKLRS